MLSLNPFKKPACREAALARTPNEDRCTRLFANGGRCRNPIAHDSTGLCAFHRDQAAKAESEAQAAAVVQELYGQVANLNSEAAVAHVLANLFRLIAQDRIPPRRAALLASTARAILRALKDNHQAQRNESLDNERKSEEEKSRRIEAEFTDWARSFPGPRSTEPRSEKPADFSNPANHAPVAPNSSLRRDREGGRTCSASFAAENPTSPDNSISQSQTKRSTLNAGAAALELKGAGSDVCSTLDACLPVGTARRSTRSTSAPPQTPPRQEPAPAAPKICHTYQEAFAETLRQCRLTDPDLPDYVSDDIAVHNAEFHEKKPDISPVKFGFRWAGPPRNR